MIRWFLRGVSHQRVTTRYPRGEEPAPARFRARALLDPWALSGEDSSALCGGLPSRGADGRSSEVDSRSTPAGASGAVCAWRLAARTGLEMDPGYELASTGRERLVVSADDGAEADIKAPRSDGCVSPLASHPPHRHRLRWRGRAGDRRAAEPLLRHAAPRTVLHRESPPRRHSAGHRSGHRSDGAAAAADL